MTSNPLLTTRSTAADRAWRLWTVSAAAMVLALPGLLAGCGTRLPGLSSDVMRIESLGEDAVGLSSRFQTTVYSDSDAVETTFLLSDASASDLLAGTIQQGQVIHVELLWQPRAGRTPIAAAATNASVRYIVISNGEMGIYGGAGFASPHGSVGGKTTTVTIRDASLKLLEHTEGFVDLLTPARLSGTFTARHDPRQTRQLHYAVSQMVTNTFGRSKFVGAWDRFGVGEWMALALAAEE